MADVENVLVDETGEEVDTPEEVSPMDVFKAEVKKLTTEYLGYEPNALVIHLAIEQFAAIRNYPVSYTEEMKIVDMEKNIAKIAMAVVEIDAKDGVEGQTAHGESGYSRTYSKYIMAYKDVVGFANAF